jgi:hypothetical protein
MRINRKRALLGGLVAGIVICLSAITMVPVVGNEMDLALARFNLPPLSPEAMVFFTFVSLTFGQILVWSYAAVLPRFGPGPKTAIIVALVIWVQAYLFSNVSMVFYGFMPVKLTVIGTVWGLGEILVAGIIGTRFYREG